MSVNKSISAHFTRTIKIGVGVIVFSLILVFVILALPDEIVSALGNIQMSLENKQNDVENLKPQLHEVHSETSPDGLREIILYERPFTGESDREYGNYLNNQYLFVVREFERWIEREVYIGDYKVGNPHWLSNDFVFFTGGCGTGCRGLHLVDIKSKESYKGVITTTPVSKDSYMTHLHDWFDHEFEFIGFDKNIRSVYLDGKTYLIFEMWNKDQAIGEKIFIFTGNSLKEQ